MPHSERPPLWETTQVFCPNCLKKAFNLREMKLSKQWRKEEGVARQQSLRNKTWSFVFSSSHATFLSLLLTCHVLFSFLTKPSHCCLPQLIHTFSHCLWELILLIPRARIALVCYWGPCWAAVVVPATLLQEPAACPGMWLPGWDRRVGALGASHACPPCARSPWELLFQLSLNEKSFCPS